MLRVTLPDRPGSLGAVATAMGQAGADIKAVEVVDQRDGSAVDDFMLVLPHGVAPDTLISECEAIDGVHVLWLSRYHSDWGVESDIATLERMVAQPDRAIEILASEAPVVFHSAWAMVIDTDTLQPRWRSEMAPELDSDTVPLLGALDQPRTAELPQGWLPDWSDTMVATAPLQPGLALVLGRTGGPAYLPGEIARLSHLAALAARTGEGSVELTARSST